MAQELMTMEELQSSAAIPSSPAQVPSSTRTTDGTESVGLSTIPDDGAEDVRLYRETDEGKKLIAWVLSSFEQAVAARSLYDTNWRRNYQYLRRHQHGNAVKSDIGDKILAATPAHKRRPRKLVINRLRSFVRSEHSKFISQDPTIIVVPSSSDDVDYRAASSAEQAWRSISSAGSLEMHMSEAEWWKVVTGNSFIKTYWDGGSIDPVSGELGMVRYGAVTPFHLFVPDLREVSLEDQPFVINGYTKTLAWAQRRYAKELEGVAPGELSLNRRLDNPANMQITEPPSSVVLLEVWVKPGAVKYLPEGGLLHLAGSTLVGITKHVPYQHGAYPYAHLRHLDSGAFYGDCSVDDLIELQDEYNELRSDLRRAGRTMGRPQILAQKGSITASKLTNEAGLVIEYQPGMAPPTPIPLAEVPGYVQAQQDRILADFEDISGQHEVSRGQAPGRGVTAGTAIAYLQESDDQYLTPQYRNTERAWEKVAKQSLELFVQFVPMPRKIKSIGDDRAFDTMLLSGADIKNGTDVRVEKGSTISTSQVARRAEIKEMVGIGMITPQQGLEMLEMGGVEKLRETFDIARSKAQRENIKMKSLDGPTILSAQDSFVEQTIPTLDEKAVTELLNGMPTAGMDQAQVAEALQQALRAQSPALIPADDFDLHELHIEMHNQYRMSQGFEQLAPEVKTEFEKHIQQHQGFLQQQLAEQLAQQAVTGTTPDEMAAAQDATAAGGVPIIPQEGTTPTGEVPTRADLLRGGVAPQTSGL